jgi:hypothetical protein
MLKMCLKGPFAATPIIYIYNIIYMYVGLHWLMGAIAGSSLYGIPNYLT